MARTPSRARSGARTKLVLNVAPVDFADSEIEVGVLPFEGREQLAQLREKHDPTHVFRRDSATDILAVPYVTTAPRLGVSFRNIRLSENLDLCAALVPMPSSTTSTVCQGKCSYTAPWFSWPTK